MALGVALVGSWIATGVLRDIRLAMLSGAVLLVVGGVIIRQVLDIQRSRTTGPRLPVSGRFTRRTSDVSWSKCGRPGPRWSRQLGNRPVLALLLERPLRLLLLWGLLIVMFLVIRQFLSASN